MPVGGYYIDRSELDEFAKKLEEFGGSVKDLNKVYRSIGKYAGDYVKTHEPIPSYDTSKNSASHLPLGYMQSQTKGSGGKYGAWVTIRNVPYLFIHEFGGGVRWRKEGPASYIQKTAIGVSKRGHYITRNKRVKNGYIVYTKPRRRMGYFIWNVAYRLRSYIGETLCREVQYMAHDTGIDLNILSSDLGIKQEPGPTG